MNVQLKLVGFDREETHEVRAAVLESIWSQINAGNFHPERTSASWCAAHCSTAEKNGMWMNTRPTYTPRWEAIVSPVVTIDAAGIARDAAGNVVGYDSTKGETR